MNPIYVSKERLSSAFLNCGRSFRQLSTETPLCRATIMKIVDKKNYTFETYEKAIAYCRKIYPNEDWSYTTMEELAFFYTKNIPPRDAAVNPIMRNNFLSGNNIPKVDNYIILCECKMKMEATA